MRPDSPIRPPRRTPLETGNDSRTPARADFNVTRNASEILFEEYLTCHGYADWTHEPEIEGKRKRPDYRLYFRGEDLFFEVKEFDTARLLDRCGPLREKINQAAWQFKEYREYCCSLVVANPNFALVHLECEAILEAMFGNLGFRFQPGASPTDADGLQPIFMGGGKIVDYKRGQPQNTTISSIVVLTRYPLRQKRISISQKLIALCPVTGGEEPVRVAVYENPYARMPLTREVFRGPFDERWGVDGDDICRLWLGERLLEIERELGPQD
jgi:hypothetical protein